MISKPISTDAQDLILKYTPPQMTVPFAEKPMSFHALALFTKELTVQILILLTVLSILSCILIKLCRKKRVDSARAIVYLEIGTAYEAISIPWFNLSHPGESYNFIFSTSGIVKLEIATFILSAMLSLTNIDIKLENVQLGHVVEFPVRLAFSRFKIQKLATLLMSKHYIAISIEDEMQRVSAIHVLKPLLADMPRSALSTVLSQQSVRSSNAM
jgi:hypothetical protein